MAGNVELQQLKHFINFSWLLDRVGQFPSILEEAKDVFEKVKEMAANELKDQSKLQVIHGDFWTGKLVSSSSTLLESRSHCANSIS